VIDLCSDDESCEKTLRARIRELEAENERLRGEVSSAEEEAASALVFCNRSNDTDTLKQELSYLVSMLFLQETDWGAEIGMSEEMVSKDVRVGEQMETLTTRFIAVYKQLGKLVGATEVKPTTWTGFGVTPDGKLKVEQKMEDETSYRFEDVIEKMRGIVDTTKAPPPATEPVVLVQEDIATLKL